MKPHQSRRKFLSSSIILFFISFCCAWITHEATLPVAAAATVTAVQAHFGDASFAGGMAYDPTLQVVYVTGQVGPSSCFVGVVKKTSASSGGSSSLQFLSKHVFSESAVCQTLALRNDQQGTPLLLSVAEEGGLLTDTRPNGSQKAVQYGAMIELQFTSEGTTGRFSKERSVLMHQDLVQIPRSIVVDPRLGNRVFVATMTSQASKIRDDFQGNQQVGMPKLTPGGDLKYGSNFAMTIESVRLASSTDDTAGVSGSNGLAEARSQWKKPFGVTGDSSRTGVVVNQLIFHGDDQLIVVGSTRGSGYAFGQAPDETMAGFIAKLDPDNGSLGMSERYHVEREGQNMPTQIEAVCQDESDPESLYVVGSFVDTTTGSDVNNATTPETPTEANTRIPIVTKFSASNFHAVWVKTFPATASAYALACGVSQNTAGESVLYVAGVVEAGGEIMGQTTTHLQDDIFVMQLITSDGSAVWMKQVGTSGNDRLAHGGGGMVVLEDGGVLLMGDTTGNLYSTSSSQSSEIFVVQVDSHGVTPDASEVSGVDYSQGQEKIGISAPVKIGEVPVSTPPDSLPGAAPTPSPVPPSIDNEDSQGDSDPPTPANNAADLSTDGATSSTSSFVVEQMYLLMAIVVFIFVGCFCFVCIRQRQREKNTERALVFSYLQAFDVEDIDVRHSATGGWHGTYVGKLAKGEGTVDRSGIEKIEYRDHPDDAYGGRSRTSSDDGSSSDGTLRSSFSHSSIIRDSLFVDYDSKPSYGDVPPPVAAISGGRRRSSMRSSRGSFLSSTSDLDRDDEDERSSFIRALNGDDFNLARLSKKASAERQSASDPWGKEIV